MLPSFDIPGSKNCCTSTSSYSTRGRNDDCILAADNASAGSDKEVAPDMGRARSGAEAVRDGARPDKAVDLGKADSDMADGHDAGADDAAVRDDDRSGKAGNAAAGNNLF